MDDAIPLARQCKGAGERNETAGSLGFGKRDHRAGFVTGEDNPMGMTFKPDGTIMYLTGYTTDDVFQIPLSTAWDISTHGTITSVDVSIEGKIVQHVMTLTLISIHIIPLETIN